MNQWVRPLSCLGIGLSVQRLSAIFKVCVRYMTSLNRNLYWVWGLWAGLGPVFQSMGFGSSWVSCSGCEVSELSGGLKRGCEVSEFCLPFYPLVSSLEKLMDLYCQLWSLWALWGSVVRISDVWVVKYKVSEVFGSLSLGVLLWTIFGVCVRCEVSWAVYRSVSQGQNSLNRACFQAVKSLSSLGMCVQDLRLWVVCGIMF